MVPYLINKETLALLPDKNKVKIYEGTKVYFLKENMYAIIDRSCYCSGSTLEGRQKASGYLLGSSYKPPIILDENSRLILIPTHSLRNKMCSWVVLNNVLNYKPTASQKVIIEFKNQRKILINCSFSIFDNQVMRATRLESILRGRNIKKHL